MSMAAPVDGDKCPIHSPGLQFVDRRIFLRKIITLLVTTFALGPVLIWKHELAAMIYVAILVLIHIWALVVFIYRLEWRGAFANPGGLLLRGGGLLFFGVLLGLVQLDGQSPLFWWSLTLIWLLHVAALGLFHLRYFLGPRAGPLLRWLATPRG